MESEEAKLFVGGITWETTEETLRNYFSNYGDVTHAVVMHDKLTGRPRGFGFVIFSDPFALDSILQNKHTVDGRMVEVKRALSREEQNAVRQDPSNGGGGNGRTKKIFVGGLPPSLTEEAFRQYFENFGQVTDCVIMIDQSTQRPRGFGFISMDTEDAVDRVLQKNFHELNGKDVEVKRAQPKDANSASGNRGGGYQNYGSSRGNSGSYGNRMDGNSYMQPQSGGYSSYPGYSAAGYGGPAGGYGAYAGYGVGGYAGGFAAGYGGSNAGGAAGYGSGAANAMKAAWSNQAAAYGPSGYGAGYGPTAGYGNGASAQTGQSAGYGNQTYGGGYGGNGYGAVGGRTSSGPTNNADGGDQSANQSASEGGYMGAGYTENNRNSGYGDAQSWQGQPY